MRVEGKVAIVTGAGLGIGKAIALTLAKEGADVVVADVDLQSAEKVVDEVKSMGRKGLAVKVDVSKKEDVDQMVKKTLDAFKRIDILVNNAGTEKIAPSIELSEADWDRVIDVNLKGEFLCSQAVGREMIKQKRGKIINIASTAGYRAMPGMAAYSASKSGVQQLTKVLAIEWARYNINVNSVSPGFTMTPMVETIFRENPEFLKDRVKAIPIQRANEPEEIANAVLFLASEESDTIVGQDIVVDGGSCAIHPGSAVTLVLESREQSDSA